MKRRRRVFAAILAGVAAVSCATPAARVAEFSARQQFQSLLLPGDGYSLVAYFKPGLGSGKVLHVYLEHDGAAWIAPDQVAVDPTPRQTLMLAAMAQDSSPSLYLGRPCYFGRSTDMGCGPRLWTHERYSQTVVNAMANALQSFLPRHSTTRLIFLGYSGGGALAMLLAEQFPETQVVVTVAGNLDIVAWAKRHDYSPLEGSLNPAERQPLPSRVKQFHYVGGLDTNVPPVMTESIPSLPQGSVINIPKFDHVCCWQAWWPSLLRSLESQLVTN